MSDRIAPSGSVGSEERIGSFDPSIYVTER